ncbi:3,4-dihydroxy-2-butanone 4-phosphate synthase [Vibrio ishigakensis]|uniref:3,4-dihydroxy-2-butanone 4-phosphate synthase n=1 Tax=Vibrio ishigakensis TaxID=1481914 RepID=A0A0B8Q1E5_9VIBR|nr:3,4-dihydroxy-2-butanone 4-phosphate synthase [Vibrio ishigakensis]
MAISSIEEILEDYRQGKMVILMDDEDRENEGDIMIAAECISPETINFMATHGRGLICLTLTQKRCQNLNLIPMVSNPTEPWATAFTVSIEAAEGVTTGISAEDRSVTVQAAVAKDAVAADLVQPGHIFPLAAKDGGVLNRAGHTEAGCDLPRLAGFEPASVIVEILNPDGTMARRPELEVFAEEHGIKLGTIADLIAYRNRTETTVERIAQCKLPTEFGEFDMVTYQDTIDKQVHYALKKGEISKEPSLVRVHMPELFNDLFASTRQGARNWPIERALSKVGEEGGVVVILGKDEDSNSKIAQVKRMQAEESGKPVLATKGTDYSRQVGVGSQILADLGISKMKLLSSGNTRYHSLSGFGLEIVEYVTE